MQFPFPWQMLALSKYLSKSFWQCDRCKCPADLPSFHASKHLKRWRRGGELHIHPMVATWDARCNAAHSAISVKRHKHADTDAASGWRWPDTPDTAYSSILTQSQSQEEPLIGLILTSFWAHAALWMGKRLVERGRDKIQRGKTISIVHTPFK